MTRETNFVDLYRLLNVQPGCDIAEFKTAYRRRVAALHPDRRGDAHEDRIASERLQQLTTLYSAAMAFRRRHGRLPGALFTRPPDAAVREQATRAPVALSRGHTSRWWPVVLALVLGGAWLIWNPDWFSGDLEPDSSTDAVPATSRGADADEPVPTSTDSIEIGMAADVVRSIEGEPIVMGDSRWEYGPSWIRFEHGAVVDWYSSPLHPLKTPPSHPQTTDN